MGSCVHWQEPSAVRLDQFRKRKVINLDNPVRDHSFYFVNKAPVLPRLARAINGGDYPWSGAGITPIKRRDHISKVNLLAILRLVAVALVISHLALTFAWSTYHDKSVGWVESGVVGSSLGREVYCQITNGTLYSPKYSVPQSDVDAMDAEACKSLTSPLKVDASGLILAIPFVLWVYESIRRRLFVSIS